jgi:hypothetical protein
MKRWFLAFIACSPVMVWIGILAGWDRPVTEFLRKVFA